MQVLEAILNRRSRDGPAAGGGERVGRARLLRARIFDVVRFVQNHAQPLDASQSPIGASLGGEGAEGQGRPLITRSFVRLFATVCS